MEIPKRINISLFERTSNLYDKTNSKKIIKIVIPKKIKILFFILTPNQHFHDNRTWKYTYLGILFIKKTPEYRYSQQGKHIHQGKK